MHILVYKDPRTLISEQIRNKSKKKELKETMFTTHNPAMSFTKFNNKIIIQSILLS